MAKEGNSFPGPDKRRVALEAGLDDLSYLLDDTVHVKSLFGIRISDGASQNCASSAYLALMSLKPRQDLFSGTGDIVRPSQLQKADNII